jgi:hypothetical protein
MGKIRQNASALGRRLSKHNFTGYERLSFGVFRVKISTFGPMKSTVEKNFEQHVISRLKANF